MCFAHPQIVYWVSLYCAFLAVLTNELSVGVLDPIPSHLLRMLVPTAIPFSPALSVSFLWVICISTVCWNS